MAMNGKNHKELLYTDPLSFCSLKAYESAKPKDLTEEQSEKLKKFLDKIYNKKGRKENKEKELNNKKIKQYVKQ